MECLCPSTFFGTMFCFLFFQLMCCMTSYVEKVMIHNILHIGLFPKTKLLFCNWTSRHHTGWKRLLDNIPQLTGKNYYVQRHLLISVTSCNNIYNNRYEFQRAGRIESTLQREFKYLLRLSELLQLKRLVFRNIYI